MSISRVWITGPGQVEVRQTASPTPKAGEAVVRTARSGVCGSDLHTYRVGHVWLPYPIPPGHEASGIVETVGAEVTTLRAGDRVFLNPALTCGACLYCRTGHSNLCEKLLGIGAHLPGGMADAFVAPAQALWPVPDSLSMADAAMIEPMATGVHAARLAGGVRAGAGDVARLAIRGQHGRVKRRRVGNIRDRAGPVSLPGRVGVACPVAADYLLSGVTLRQGPV